ncbi:VOC family protein [Deinococcus apachensis]|uniref:VOC family protein n=1 Tax=Deinococcus apachensis TaxID=309886 RepID=UPI00037BAFF7|nr:VOC family protein [Deinococcus apachensis]
MTFLDVYPLITTPDLTEVRSFYPRWFEATLSFDSSWFVLFTLPGERPFSLAFMSPDHPSRPPGPEPFGGLGMILTLQVADAAVLYERLRDGGLTPYHPLCDEPWGQRRFMVRDPAGLLLDVVEQTEPSPGFWDAYLPDHLPTP